MSSSSIVCLKPPAGGQPIVSPKRSHPLQKKPLVLRRHLRMRFFTPSIYPVQARAPPVGTVPGRPFVQLRSRPLAHPQPLLRRGIPPAPVRDSRRDRPCVPSKCATTPVRRGRG